MHSRSAAPVRAPVPATFPRSGRLRRCLPPSPAAVAADKTTHRHLRPHAHSSQPWKSAQPGGRAPARCTGGALRARITSVAAVVSVGAHIRRCSVGRARRQTYRSRSRVKTTSPTDPRRDIRIALASGRAWLPLEQNLCRYGFWAGVSNFCQRR